MQPLKPGKDNTYAISQYNNIQNLGQYLVSYHDINIIFILYVAQPQLFLSPLCVDLSMVLKEEVRTCRSRNRGRRCCSSYDKPKDRNLTSCNISLAVRAVYLGLEDSIWVNRF